MPKFFGRGKKGPEGGSQSGPQKAPEQPSQPVPVTPITPEPQRPVVPESQNPIAELNTLAGKLQQLHATLGAGGEYTSTRAEFEQAFNNYVPQLISLLRNPSIKSYCKREDGRIVIHGPLNNGKPPEVLPLSPSGIYSIEVLPEEPESISLVYRYMYKEEGQISQRKLELDRLFPSELGFKIGDLRRFNYASGQILSEYGINASYDSSGVYNEYGYKGYELYRQLTAMDLLNWQGIGIHSWTSNWRDATDTVFSMFTSGNKEVIDSITENIDWQINSMSKAIPQMSIERVLAEAASTGNPITPQQAQELAQNVAESTAVPQLAQGVTEEQFRAMVATMVQEYLTTYEPKSHRRGRHTNKNVEKRIHDFSQGNKQTETVLQRIIRHSKDPERLLEAAITLATLIPGAQKVASLVEFANIMAGPDNEL